MIIGVIILNYFYIPPPDPMDLYKSLYIEGRKLKCPMDQPACFIGGLFVVGRNRPNRRLNTGEYYKEGNLTDTEVVLKPC